MANLDICEKYKNRVFYNEIDFVTAISKYPRKYIYGAGYVGKLVQKRLVHHKIEICGFIVSNENNENNLIFPLEEIEKNSQTMIIVAVTDTYRNEIIERLDEKGFFQYVIVSDKLIKTMERLSNQSLHFQTHLVEHCNLKCRGCYHFSPLAKEKYLDLEEYKSDLQRLSELFHGRAEEILLLGGEPLLHPQINSFLEISRKYFPIGEIKVLTNGLLLLDIDATFFQSLRENDIQLWVTKYPVNFDYKSAELRAKKFDVDIQYFMVGETVRSLGHEPLDLSGMRNYKNNFNHCYRAHECVDLKHGRLYPCIVPAEIEAFRDFFNVDIPVSEEDSVDIYQVKTADELLYNMEKAIPFCRFCNRDDIQIVGKIPWSISKFDIKEWIE